jgi:protocatechuate 3,4-dioxygenase beta subunit
MERVKEPDITTATQDVNPPYDFPTYAITKYLAPHENLIELPSAWLRDTPGPSYARIPVQGNDSDLRNQCSGKPIGQHIVIYGRVVDRFGRPVPNALVELWQTNASGRYTDRADGDHLPLDPNFVGVGHFTTNDKGEYRFYTIKPPPYPAGRGGPFRPAHIHISVFGPDLASRLITQIYFPDDQLVMTDWITTAVSNRDAAKSMIAAFRGAELDSNGLDTLLAYEWNIILRGELHGAPDTDIPVADVGVQTPSQTIGPMYGFALMFDGSESACDPYDAEAVTITGQLFDGQGNPIPYPIALLEFWEGDQFLRTRTDSTGSFSLTARKPKGQQLPDGTPLAPHLNVTIFGRGLLKQAQTRMYFSDEAVPNAADVILTNVPEHRRARLVATASGEGAFNFDIYLQGEKETPFFAF